jgi:predicted protein tyrosine phosphatase
MKFAFIDRHRDRWPIVVMCRVLGVSRSGFFAWCKRPPSAGSQHRAELTEQVRQVHEANRKVYMAARACIVRCATRAWRCV